MVELADNGAAAAASPERGWTLRGAPAALGGALLEGLRRQPLLLMAVALYALVAYAAARLAGVSEHFSISLYSGVQLQLLGIFVFGATCLVYPLAVIAVVRPARPLRHIAQGWREHFFTRERVVVALPALIALPLLLSVYTSMKTLIPVFDPYTWDLPLAAFDRWLHGGSDPWRLLQPLLGEPLVTHAINIVYNLWFFIVYGVTLWQVFQTRDLQSRNQYLLSFVLAWAVLGTLMASLFASGGPVYYQHFAAGGDPFAPLMAYLYEVNESYPIWALQAQEMLWREHSTNHVVLGGGISAMPSLHVATALLSALVSWRHSRALGWAMVAFTVLIVLGSVHLGWHYAIDGYASMLLTPLLWWGAGWLVRRWGERRAAG